MFAEIRAKDGRVAYSAAKGGRLIPHNKWMTVLVTPWIERLAEVHGDIDLKPIERSKRSRGRPKKEEVELISFKPKEGETAANTPENNEVK